MLTIEDGSGVTGADSYVDLAFLDEYAMKYGKTDFVALTDPEKEVHARFATDFIDSMEDRYSGYRTYARRTQTRAWPRTGVLTKRERYIAYDYNLGGFTGEVNRFAIPEEVKAAQAEAAIMRSEGIDLEADPGTEGDVKRVRVDVIEEEYFEGTNRSTSVRRFSRIYNLLKPLFETTGSTVRIYRG